jgi:hypothetical protein
VLASYAHCCTDLLSHLARVDADSFDQLTGHLTPAHMNYFSHWDRLIDLEEAEMYRNREEVRLRLPIFVLRSLPVRGLTTTRSNFRYGS